MTAQRNPGVRPIGYGTRRGDEQRITVTFDRETFDAVRARAVKGRTSFTAQVLLLVEWGLEAAAEPAAGASPRRARHG